MRLVGSMLRSILIERLHCHSTAAVYRGCIQHVLNVGIARIPLTRFTDLIGLSQFGEANIEREVALSAIETLLRPRG